MRNITITNFIISCVLASTIVLLWLVNLPNIGTPGLERPFGLLELYVLIGIFILAPISILIGLITTLIAIVRKKPYWYFAAGSVVFSGFSIFFISFLQSLGVV